MNEHQEIIDNIPAYALGILGKEETEWVAAHLADCAACTAELHAYQETVGLLGQAVPEAAAPAALKEKVMAQAQPAAPKPAKKAQKPPWRPPTIAGTPVFSIASVALILLLAISNLILMNRVRSMETNTFAVINLAAEQVMPAAKGMIIVSADGRYGTLVVSDMSQLDENQQYQLWLIKGDERTSGGVFSVSQSGYTAFQVHSREPLDSFDGFGITIEPLGGSPGPTGDKVLGAEL
jgi:anti-sigma-K factor RskA